MPVKIAPCPNFDAGAEKIVEVMPKTLAMLRDPFCRRMRRFSNPRS
jgi:hypothetical protein